MDITLTAGAAETVITPPIGISLAGYFHDRIAQRVRDDLLAKALVLECNGEYIALVSCDLIGISVTVADQVAREVEKRIGIPASRVLVAATHTHTGPATEPLVVSVNEEWLAGLPEKLVQAVCDAHQRRRPAQMRVGRGQETQLSFNRLMRTWERGGRQVFGTGGSTDDGGTGEAGEEIAGPAGPIDPEVVVVRLVASDGHTIAFVVNFALHVDVIGGGSADFISADWPGIMAQTLKQVYGDETVTLFLNGACGDINHVDYLGLSGAIQDLGPEEKATQLGRALAAVAMNIGEKAPAAATPLVAGIRETVNVPYLSPQEVAAAVKELEDVLAAESAGALQYVKEMAARDDLWGHDAILPVQSLRIGELAIVGVPCEYFVSWGLDIKKWSPAPFTVVAELANGWFGYVPTWEAALRGGYGAVAVWSRRLAPEAGQRLADCAFVQLQRLWK